VDPDETLDQMRQAVDEYENASTLGLEAEAAERLIERFVALDEWLSGGGFAPADWRHEGAAL
jgi:hypothetical protein